MHLIRTFVVFFTAAFLVPDSLLGQKESPVTEAALLQRFEKELKPIWADGDTATVIYQSPAESVNVWLGGKLVEMQRVADSDWWFAKQGFPKLRKGMLNYSYVVQPDAGSPAKQKSACYWRGEEAPEAIEIANKLKGQLLPFNVASDRLSTKSRAITVYLPPSYVQQRDELRTKSPKGRFPVIFMADGQATANYARAVEPLVVARKVKPFVIVGVHNGGYLGKRKPDLSDYDITKDLRASEYLIELHLETFQAHEEFFCDEVVRWAEEKFSVGRTRNDRAVMGHSNGGSFAIQMGLRNSEKFGNVIAFSPGAGPPISKATLPRQKTSFFLAAGIWEKPFHERAFNYHKSLRANHIPTEFCSRVAGHDERMWQEEFASFAKTIFKPDARKD